jgi:hypothetical protein
MTDPLTLEMKLLEAEAEEAAARARVEVYRRALGTRAPDRSSARRAKPVRALAPARPMNDTEKADAERLANEMQIPVRRQR